MVGYGRYGRYDGAYGSHHEICDLIDKSLKLPKIFSLEGNLVMSKVTFEEIDIIQSDIFEDRDPDDEDFSGYTGNEGASTTHWYHNTVGASTIAKACPANSSIGTANHAESQVDRMVRSERQEHPDSRHVRTRFCQIQSDSRASRA